MSRGPRVLLVVSSLWLAGGLLVSFSILQIQGSDSAADRSIQKDYVDVKAQYKLITYKGLKRVEGDEFDVLECVYEDGTQESLYLDVTTQLIAMEKSGPATVNFSEYRKVGGIQIPHAVSVSMGDLRDVLAAQYDEVKHDGEIDDAIFAVPK